MTLSRLERAGLVDAREVAQPSHPDKKVYELTASGRERVLQWFNDVTWSKVAPLEFHLKLVAAAATRLADPVTLIDSQRLELLRQLRQLLADPIRAADFVAAHQSLEAVPASSSVIAYMETWQQRRTESHSDIDILAGTLFAAGTLIAILAIATASVLIAGRMAARIHQVGTLKAVGVTPRQVLLVLLLEHLAVAAGATAVGLGIGRLLAPPIAQTSVTVLGRPEPPPLTLTRVMIVVALALRDSLDLLELRPPEPGHVGSDAAVTILDDQVRAIVLGTAGLLLVLATVNAWIVATFAARLLARQPIAPLLAYE